jgi:hypothetical protein
LFIDKIGCGPDFSFADPWDEHPTAESTMAKIDYYVSLIKTMRKERDVSSEALVLKRLNAQFRNLTSTRRTSSR